jgi:hypothetical protein
MVKVLSCGGECCHRGRQTCLEVWRSTAQSGGGVDNGLEPGSLKMHMHDGRTQTMRHHVFICSTLSSHAFQVGVAHLEQYGHNILAIAFRVLDAPYVLRV